MRNWAWVHDRADLSAPLYSIHCAKVLMRRVIAYLIAVELIAATVTIIRAFS